MQKILMNYYEYDKERHIIMVDVYLLPANGEIVFGLDMEKKREQDII